MRFFRRFTAAGFVLAALIFLSIIQNTLAQEGLDLVQTAEYDIGFGCPVASALDPDGSRLWLLMNTCGTRNYTLHVYAVADGTQLEMDDYADELLGLEGTYIDSFINPMAFTPDGDISIRYNDAETYESIELLIPVANGGEASSIKSASYNALLAESSEYPEFSVYSPDHSLVVAAGLSGFHVIDIASETEILEIPFVAGNDYGLASFSQDSNHLYTIYPQNPEDMDDFSSIFQIYNLADGAKLQEYVLPSSALWPSPDERYVAIQNFSNNIGDLSEIFVMDLETGESSAASNLLEEPHSVVSCVNNGNSMTDVDFTTTGYFTPIGLNWLPDSSGFFLPLSYGGEASGSGANVCYFNYSRLRSYQLAGGE